MSRQGLDLRRSGQILWRHKIILGGCALLGLAGNAALTMLASQTYTSNTLVVVSPNVNLETQAVVVDSIPVLADAMSKANLGMSLQQLQAHVQATAVGTQTISIQAQGASASWAQAAASAVTKAYVAYTTSTGNPEGPQPATVFLPATTPAVKPLSTRLWEASLLGLIGGTLVGLIIALGLGRSDRRLRLRDDIADSIGVPVVASLSVRAPKDAAGWATIIGKAEPDGADAWRLRHVLREASGRAARSPCSRWPPTRPRWPSARGWRRSRRHRECRPPW